ncbi:MAG TPA: aminotransferase class V-fold PLP-dependent enzyme, partial [Thermoanaerobaculia bacterium]|nr:aminotransferase class V-fold PLP-dependent enzyme [Thermoanaerobaculia bacterium]
LVDAVSSLGGMPVEVDAWGIDVCLASVQKGMALPPGITLAAVSEAALRRAAKHPYRGTYFDFLEYKRHADADGVPSTPSISHFYALARQLDDILRRETLPARFERHRRMRDRTIERTASFAELAADRQHASSTVTALRPSIDPELIRSRMRERGYTIGGGYGEWKKTTFRIGHMGDIPMESLEAMLDDLEECGRA